MYQEASSNERRSALVAAHLPIFGVTSSHPLVMELVEGVAEGRHRVTDRGGIGTDDSKPSSKSCWTWALQLR